MSVGFNHDNFRRGERLKIVVGGGKNAQRLDNYLCSRFSHLSRAKMQRIIRSQGVDVNSMPSKPSRRIYAGDVVEFDLPDTELLAESMPLDIIYEDEYMLALNKQPGVLVHPSRGNSSGTILNGLVGYAAGKYKPDIVHRLDRNTSGVIIFSKNEQVNAALSEQFSARTAEKTYLAIVHRAPEPASGTIELPISEAADSSEKYAVDDAGKYALTLYKTLKTWANGNSLLEIALKTGRTHQIRVHLSHIGCPIVADTLYGGKIPTQKDCPHPIERCALHSYRLILIHPITQEPMDLSAPLPLDFKQAIPKS